MNGKLSQESLLPGTDAIRKSTVEFQHYKRGYLVRYKSPAGLVQQRQFKDRLEAGVYFWGCIDKLSREVRGLE